MRKRRGGPTANLTTPWLMPEDESSVLKANERAEREATAGLRQARVEGMLLQRAQTAEREVTELRAALQTIKEHVCKHAAVCQLCALTCKVADEALITETRRC